MEEEEREVDNDIGRSQLAGIQYKLTQWGKYRRGRTNQIIEREMPGMRKEIPKEETSKCYGDAARKAGATVLWGGAILL